jgi:hypothetical protein
MTEVYKFFGFGPNFIDVMDTIGTGRTASIIYEDGSISENFNLETGRPQGDGPSPLQYNMGEEIVLLKIELDPSVASVFQHALVPRFALDLVPDPRRRGVDVNYNDHLAMESNRETDKADGFADDNSTATLANFECLNSLKKIISDFADFSGLKSNVEKTTLMQIGTVNQLSDEIKNLGFKSVTEVTILGLTINRDLSSLTQHFESTISTIVRMIEYWERFNLSLPGRISVCKTFMISQIGYIGSIIRPTVQQEKRMQKLMDDFCVGSMRTAKKKLYTPLNEGGLGLINVNEFITALQCAWIKRVTQHWGDNWRYDIKAKCDGNPLLANELTVSQNEHPILYNICKSFGTFKREFYLKDDNYKQALIFKNPIFRRSRVDNGLLCERFFGTRNDFNMNKKLSVLKYADFFIRGGPKSLEDINMEFSLNLTLVTYMRLHESLQFFVNSRRDNDVKLSQSLDFFLKSFEKGSKPFRKILSFRERKNLNISVLNTVKTFIDLVDIAMPEGDVLRACWGEWQRNYYGNRCKEFLYKYRNNILGTNQRVAHFVPNYSAECSLCTANNEPLPIQAESFMHVFFDCTYSRKYRETLIRNYFPELVNGDIVAQKNLLFFGLAPGMQHCNMFISGIVSQFNFLIWTVKLQKKLIPVNIFFEDLNLSIYKMLKMSNKIREAKQNLDLYVCRHTFDPP